MLDGLVNVFADFGLNINWKPGKTECMIRLRGRWSGVVFRELCCNGGRQIAVLGTSPVVHLHIVKRYTNRLEASCKTMRFEILMRCTSPGRPRSIQSNCVQSFCERCLLCTAQVPAVECADQQQVADLRSCCVSQHFLHSAPPKCLHESAAPHAWRIVI